MPAVGHGQPVELFRRRDLRDLGSMLWSQFSAIFTEKYLAFFSKTNILFKFLHNLALFLSQKYTD
jgi:hypothetical protein